MRKNRYKKLAQKIDCKYLYFKSKILTFLCKHIGNECDKIIPRMRKHRSLRKSIDGKKVRPDAKALRWSKANPWFGNNWWLTERAFDIHKELINKEGYNPKSKMYYDEIDRRMYLKYKTLMKKYFSMDN